MSGVAELTESLGAGFEHGFSRLAYPTVGLEEELILVEPTSLEPVGEIDWLLGVVGSDARFKAELRAAQVELVTPICATVGDACLALGSARATLSERVDGRVRLLAAGTHPASSAPVAITRRPRYAALVLDNPWLVRCGIPSALHVHVGIADPADALGVYNAARSYLPEIAALAANSPFFEGRDSGLASSRLKLCEDSPRAGVPPAFASWRELAAFVAWGANGGLFSELGDLWWDLRPRPDLGTLEFRVADCQTDLASAGCVAAFCQSLVAALQARLRNGEELSIHPTHVIAENRWRALRDGLQGELVDADTGRVSATRERLSSLLDELDPHARTLGCSERLAHAHVLIAHGGGAERQRAIVKERGLRGLVEWLAETSEKAADTSAAEAPRALWPSHQARWKLLRRQHEAAPNLAGLLRSSERAVSLASRAETDASEGVAFGA